MPMLVCNEFQARALIHFGVQMKFSRRHAFHDSKSHKPDFGILLVIKN